MSTQVCEPDVRAAGDIEAELAMLDVLEGDAAVDGAMTFPTAFSAIAVCCTLADF